jgi:hypothetical protein
MPSSSDNSSSVVLDTMSVLISYLVNDCHVHNPIGRTLTTGFCSVINCGPQSASETVVDGIHCSFAWVVIKTTIRTNSVVGRYVAIALRTWVAQRQSHLGVLGITTYVTVRPVNLFDGCRRKVIHQKIISQVIRLGDCITVAIKYYAHWIVTVFVAESYSMESISRIFICRMSSSHTLITTDGLAGRSDRNSRRSFAVACPAYSKSSVRVCLILLPLF